MILLLMAVFALLIAVGVWRRFTAVQWIWLIAGSALLLILVWALFLVFFIGPEMQRMGPPGATRGL
ncbi:MAG TPA: hypothetical protein VK929_13535 [Longimicrobiales bacterium]|nr:hypothetical protein [Longimicrobiales bacterium]